MNQLIRNFAALKESPEETAAECLFVWSFVSAVVSGFSFCLRHRMCGDVTFLCDLSQKHQILLVEKNFNEPTDGRTKPLTEIRI